MEELILKIWAFCPFCNSQGSERDPSDREGKVSDYGQLQETNSHYIKTVPNDNSDHGKNKASRTFGYWQSLKTHILIILILNLIGSSPVVRKITEFQEITSNYLEHKEKLLLPKLKCLSIF